MKGTGVVQGLKSLAAKIHPQLPLNTKESNRLLTALTSSFRKHLDEAHPTSAWPGDQRDKDAASKHGGVAESRSHGIHSSVAYADRHLASVLTNPLLSKGGQRFDYASAKRELTENPGKDPIQLLEEYHEKNAATVRIAELCLEHFKSDVANMSAEQHKAYILKFEPGHRVFLWLLSNKVYDAADYVDNLRFQDLLVHFLVLEGREENIWDWIKMDMTIANSQKDPIQRNKRKQTLHAYRWRGRLLRALIEVKLGTMDGNKEHVSDNRLHEALDTYFNACELKLEGQRRQDHLGWIPLGGAGVLLERQMVRSPTLRTAMDVQRYDRFCKTVPLFMDGAPSFFFDGEYAKLDLCHPRHPSADGALHFWKSALDPSPGSISPKLFVDRLLNGKGNADTQWWFLVLARTIAVLRIEGRTQEASWLADRANSLFPRHSRFLDHHVEKVQSSAENVQAARTQHADEDAIRVPFPTFA